MHKRSWKTSYVIILIRFYQCLLLWCNCTKKRRVAKLHYVRDIYKIFYAQVFCNDSSEKLSDPDVSEIFLAHEQLKKFCASYDNVNLNALCRLQSRVKIIKTHIMA